MALITCPECGHQISDKARKCTKCGFSVEETLHAVSSTEKHLPTAKTSVQSDVGKTNNAPLENIVQTSTVNVPSTPTDTGNKPNHKSVALWIGIIAAIVVVGGLLAVLLINKSNNKKKNEKTAVAERAHLDSLQRVEEQRIADSTAWVNFSTPDLSFFEVHGHVKSISEENVLYEFDEDGVFEKCDGRNPYQNTGTASYDTYEYKKNNGRIVSINLMKSKNTYKWDESKVVSYKEIGVYGYPDGPNEKYTYDKDNRLIRKRGSMLWTDEETVCYYTVSYQYIDFDEYGNWVERKEIKQFDNSDYKEENTERRTITYYPSSFNRQNQQYESDAHKSSEKQSIASWIKGCWEYDGSINTTNGRQKVHSEILVKEDEMIWVLNGELAYRGTYHVDENGLFYNEVSNGNFSDVFQIDVERKRLKFVDDKYHHKTSKNSIHWNRVASSISNNRSSSKQQHYETSRDIMSYLTSHTFTNGRGTRVTFKSNGMYINGDCATGAPTVISVGNGVARVRLQNIYAGGYAYLTIYPMEGKFVEEASNGTTWYEE